MVGASRKCKASAAITVQVIGFGISVGSFVIVEMGEGINFSVGKGTAALLAAGICGVRLQASRVSPRMSTTKINIFIVTLFCVK